MHAFSPAHPRSRRAREAPAGRVKPLVVLTAGLGVSRIPARFRGRVPHCRKPMCPKCDERESASTVPLHPDVDAELCSQGHSRMLDPLERGFHRFPLAVVELLCSHPSRICGQVLSPARSHPGRC